MASSAALAAAWAASSAEPGSSVAVADPSAARSSSPASAAGTVIFTVLAPSMPMAVSSTA